MLAQSHAPTASPVHTLASIHYFAPLRAIRGSARLTSTQRLVLLVILSHVDNTTGEAAVGIPRLAEECDLTTRTIERTVAALVAAGWLARESAASWWGTNVYRVTPRPDDARPPRSPRSPRFGRPFDRVTPDRGPGDPPSRVQAPPDAGSGTLLPVLHNPAVCSFPAPSTHTEVQEHDQEHELHEHEADLATVVPPVPPVPATVVPPVPATVHEHDQEHELHEALAVHSELRALARRPVVALLAAERRPLPVVRRALAELAEHARLAVAAGEPFSAATLARKARAYVRCAYATAGEPSSCTSTTSRPAAEEPPPAAPCLASTVANLRGVLAALGSQQA